MAVDPKWVEESGVAGILESAQMRLSDDFTRYTQGEINPLQVGLRALGETGRVVGDTIGMAVEPIVSAAWNNMRPTTREFLSEGARDIAMGIMETEAAQVTAKFLQENPEIARDLGAVVNMMELVPGAAVVAKGSGGNLLNILADNYRTHNEGWYSGVPTEKAKGILVNAQDAVKETAAELASPTLRAQHRKFGTGRGRRQEMMKAEKFRTEVGNLYASRFMEQQQKNTPDLESLSANMPLVKAGILSEHRMTDTGDILQSLKFDEPDVPDDVVADLWNRMQTQFADSHKNPGMIEAGVSTLFNVKKPKFNETFVTVRDSRAPQARFAAEAAGDSPISTSRVLARVRSNNALNKFARMIGKDGHADLDTDDFFEFMRQNSLVEKHSWKKIRRGIPDKFKYDKKGNAMGPGSAHDYYMTSKIAEKSHASKMDKWRASEGERYKIGPKKGQLKPRPEKPKGLSEKQQFYVDLFDEKLDDYVAPKLRKDGDKIKYSTSYHSTEQDLGGAPIAMEFDVANRTGYSMGGDGHDFMGADPAGGVGLINLTPVQKWGFGDNDYKGKYQQGSKDSPEWQQKQADAIADFERRSGVKKLPEESVMDYQKRASEEFLARVQPTAKDKRDVALTGMLTGQQLINVREEETQ